MIIYFCVHNLERNLESLKKELVVKALEHSLLQKSFFFFFCNLRAFQSLPCMLHSQKEG